MPDKSEYVVVLIELMCEGIPDREGISDPSFGCVNGVRHLLLLIQLSW